MNGSRPTAFPGSRSPSTSRTRGSRGSSSRRCSRSKAAIRSRASEFCGTRRDTRSTTRTSCAAARRDAGCSGRRPRPYPEYYTPKPYSKSFVQHLDHWYAQSHPDEDFAETFAVWLDPRSMWPSRYSGLAGERKLEYMDRLMRELARARPRVTSTRRGRPAAAAAEARSASTTRASASTTASTIPTSTTATCGTCSPTRPSTRAILSAARFVRRIRREVRSTVASFTDSYQYTIDQLLEQIIVRCRESNLRLTDFGGGDQDRFHGLSDGADDELPAQRPPSGGAVTVNRLRVLALVHRHLIPPAAMSPESTSRPRRGAPSTTSSRRSAPWGTRCRRSACTTTSGTSAARRPSGSRISRSTCSKGSTTSRSSIRTS